jgi:hypothetical protein
MSVSIIFVFSSIILVLAALTASKAARDGLPFWRTFIMSIIGYTGVSLIFLKLFI